MKSMSLTGTTNRERGGIYMEAKKTAIVTGCSGQDGAYLSERLLSLGYRVVGLKRRSSTDTLWRLRYLGVTDNPNFIIEECDITDLYSLINVFQKYKPQECYNLAAMSHVGTSFSQPQLTWDVTAQGAINVANALFMVKPDSKLYQASSSEMMGSHYNEVEEHEFCRYDGEEKENVITTWSTDREGMSKSLSGWAPSGKKRTIKCQNEDSKMDGNSPYGVAKFAAHNYMRVLREGQNRFIACGILYNHGSPLRGEHFFERKVTKYIGQLVKWLDENKVNLNELNDDETTLIFNDKNFPKLRLGDLSTFRDMGHSRDYVKLQHKMLQQDTPDDFVICTGETFQMKDIVEFAFQCVGLDWEKITYIDSSLFRPREVEYLRGDCSKAKKELGWRPTETLQSMIQEMVKQDIEWTKEGRNYG